MIGWRDGNGTGYRGSLFGAFAALARGEAWSFPALRPHQASPWHAFTVQVAALALIRAGRDDLPGDEGAWRDLLIALTPDQPGGEAWELVVTIGPNRRCSSRRSSPLAIGRSTKPFWRRQTRSMFWLRPRITTLNVDESLKLAMMIGCLLW
ncbi:MAG: hypothetical protein ACRYFW_06375 [Janthinobacterium lividum]